MITAIAIITALITLVLAFGQKERETAAGFRRWLWLLMGIGLVEMLLLPTWPQRILLYLVLLHIQLSIPPSAHERYLMQVLIVVGGYCALLPYVQVGHWAQALIPAFLWLLVGVGTLTSLWSMVSVRQHYRIGHLKKFGHDLYRIPFKIGYWQFDLYEGGAIHNMCAGHMNNNFTQPLQAIFFAAGVGLTAAWSTLAAWLLPVLVFPFMAFLWTQGVPGQWIVHLF